MGAEQKAMTNEPLLTEKFVAYKFAQVFLKPPYGSFCWGGDSSFSLDIADWLAWNGLS